MQLCDDEPPQQLEEERDGQGRQAPQGQGPGAHRVQQGNLLGPSGLAGATLPPASWLLATLYTASWASNSLAILSLSWRSLATTSWQDSHLARREEGEGGRGREGGESGGSQGGERREGGGEK